MSKAEPSKKRLGRNKVEPEKRQARPRPRLAVTAMAMSDDVWPSLDQMGVDGLTVPTPAAARAVAAPVSETPAQAPEASPFSTPEFDLTDPSTAPPEAAPKTRQRRAQRPADPGQVPLSELSIAPLPDDGAPAGAPRAKRPTRAHATPVSAEPSPQVPLSDVAITPIPTDQPGSARPASARRRTVVAKDALQRPLSEIAIPAVEDGRPATKRTVATPIDEGSLNVQRPLSELTIELPSEPRRPTPAPTNATWQGLRQPRWSDFPSTPALTVSHEAVAAAIAQLEQTITAPAAVGAPHRARNRTVIAPEVAKATVAPAPSREAAPASTGIEVSTPSEPTQAPDSPNAPNAGTETIVEVVAADPAPVATDEPAASSTSTPVQEPAAKPKRTRRASRTETTARAQIEQVTPEPAPAPEPVSTTETVAAPEATLTPTPAPVEERNVQAVQPTDVDVVQPAAQTTPAVTTPNRVRRNKRSASNAAQAALPVPTASQPVVEPVAIATPVVEPQQMETTAPATSHVEAPGWPMPGEILGAARPADSDSGSSTGYTSTRLPSGVLTSQPPVAFRPYQAVYRPTDAD